MRPVGADASHSDCILVVGVSRPKLAVVFLTVMLISLFLTFHVLYDSAVYNIQAAQAVHERHRLSLAASASAAAYTASNANHLPVFVKPVASSNQLSHPMVFPSSRVHFPKTSRRLPQVSPGAPPRLRLPLSVCRITRTPIIAAICILHFNYRP